MKYKVIKDFGVAKKGDVLVSDALGFFSFDVTRQTDNAAYTRAMTIDETTANCLADNDYLVEVTDECDCKKCTCKECVCKKIDDTVALIDELVKQYDEDNKKVQEKAAKGEIQPCVKVESETVYYNLNKVLNKIREQLTNE